MEIEDYDRLRTALDDMGAKSLQRFICFWLAQWYGIEYALRHVAALRSVTDPEEA